MRPRWLRRKCPPQYVQAFADRLNRIEGVNINVCVVKNDFFGGDIHIAGLLTAQDIMAHLKSVSRLPPNRLHPENLPA